MSWEASSSFFLDEDSDDYTQRQYKSNYTVALSDKFETLDFTIKQSKISYQHNASKSQSYQKFYAMRWLLVLLTALVMAMIRFIMEMIIIFISHQKHSWLVVITQRFPQDIWLTYIGLASFNVLCMAVASGSCLLFSMEAMGGNVAGVMAYLNGTQIKRFFQVRTVLVKMLSTSAQVCGGSPGGQEGPSIHMGAAVGNIIPNFIAKIYHSHAFNHLCNICEKRDLSVCGIAAGVSCAFGAPLGGIFLALEETTSYFSADMLPRIVVCAFSAKFISDVLSQNFLESELASAEKYYKVAPHLDLTNKLPTVDIDLLEIVVPVFFGFIGAFLGVLYILLFSKLIHIRKKLKLIERKKYLFCEALVNPLIVTLFYVITLAVFSDRCTPEEEGGENHMSCPEGSVPVVSYFMITFEAGYKILVQGEPGAFPVSLVAAVFLFMYTFSLFSSSHCYSSGFFMIHFMLGALWGRGVGEALYSYYPQPWADPRKLALVGAGAQITAMARSQIAIVCLLLESSNTFESCGIAMFIATLVTKMAANVCVPSMYHLQLDVMGVPFLEADAPYGTSADVKEILKADKKLFKSTIVPRVGHLYDLTENTPKGNYPIVTAMEELLGDISRCLIYKLLASNVYDAIQPYPEARYSSLYKIIYEVECTIDFVEQIRLEMFLNVSEVDKNKNLDLTPFVNKNVFYVRPTASLHHIYQFFRQMGMRTLYVLDEMDKLSGIITRKDLARYRKHLFMGQFRKEKVNVQPAESGRSKSPLPETTSSPDDQNVSDLDMDETNPGENETE